MLIVPHESIVVAGRQRKTFDKSRIAELAESISDVGLLHSVTVVPLEDGTYNLVAGERRLRAIKSLVMPYQYDGDTVSESSIPVTVLKDDDTLTQAKAEIAENLMRVDFTWQEKVQALDELHTMLSALNPAHKVSDTAAEIADRTGQAPITVVQRVNRAALIAQHLDDPNISNASSETQAHRAVVKKLSDGLESALIKMDVGGASPHTLIHGDCLEQMPLLPDSKFDLILCDPPYGINAGSFRNASANLVHDYDDTADSALTICESIFATGSRVTKPNAHLYMFCDIEHFSRLNQMGAENGWTVWRTPLIWHKTGTNAHAPVHERGFRRNYEIILFAVKGDKPFPQVYSDVIECAQVRDKDVAAQKPVDLLTTLIKRSCLPGDSILDPTCGSGPIFTAGQANNCKVTGIEKSDEAFMFASLALHHTTTEAGE